MALLNSADYQRRSLRVFNAWSAGERTASLFTLKRSRRTGSSDNFKRALPTLTQIFLVQCSALCLSYRSGFSDSGTYLSFDYRGLINPGWRSLGLGSDTPGAHLMDV